MLPELDPSWLQALFDRFDRMALAAARRPAAEEKADGTVVTALDREVSAMVIAAVRERFPDTGIISEEEPEPYQSAAPWQWVLDPLDGTAAFARGFPVWGLGLGLLHEGTPRAGFLRFPAIDESFVCVDGAVTVNGRPWQGGAAGPLPDTENVLVGSGLQGVVPLAPLRGIKLRNYGSNLYHLVALGVGRAEAVISTRCHLWDLAQALPFTRSRGCVEVYCDGRPFDLQAVLANRAGRFRVPAPFVVGVPDMVDELLRRWR